MSSNPLDLNNIQGDILGGFIKKTESYLFFQILDAAKFKKHLAKFAPLVKSTAQVLKDRKDIEDHKRRHRQEHPGKKIPLVPVVGVNISFSRFGLDLLGVSATDINNLQDTAFANGQFKDSANLNDTGTNSGPGGSFVPNWDQTFKNHIHGLILVAGDSHASVDKKLAEIRDLFCDSGDVGDLKSSIFEIATISGDVRPGDEAGHEHFGFLDGVSNPTILGFDGTAPTGPPTGPLPVRPGIIVIGRDGDSRAPTRPAWSVDGSFLVFRYLFQLVPEFNDFLEQNPVPRPGLTHQEQVDLRGARLVGRWKSGAPVDITPFKDDPKLARANNFRFAATPPSTNPDQIKCPFAAHIRKTNPRADLEDHGFSIENRRILRRGIQFGPEVTSEENTSKTTSFGRGLLFACYQSSILDGFQFIQRQWANAPSFPFTETTPATPGFDAIIGQAAGGAARELSGTNSEDLDQDLPVPVEFVVPRGGEYFFAPSISTLKNTFAARTH